MITDKNYRYIAGQSYNVAPEWSGDTVYVDSKIIDNQFLVLATENNTSNGMQAMAVAPIINGKPDTSQIIIAYAGTNKFDTDDLQTDYQMIFGGNTNDLLFQQGDAASDTSITATVDSQAETALEFAENMMKKYPNASITTTGHSLGESLGLYVALKKNLTNVGFNGPDIANMISAEEIAYMQQHPEQFINYRNTQDSIGNIMGDVTKTAVYIDVPGNQNALSGHNMSTWQFTDDGQIKDANGNPVIHAGKRSLAMISASFAILSDFKNNVLAKDSLTNTEKVFLDSEQAAIITKNLATGAAADRYLE